MFAPTDERKEHGDEHQIPKESEDEQVARQKEAQHRPLEREQKRNEVSRPLGAAGGDRAGRTER